MALRNKCWSLRTATYSGEPYFLAIDILLLHIKMRYLIWLSGISVGLQGPQLILESHIFCCQHLAVASQNEVFNMALRNKCWPLRTTTYSGEPYFCCRHLAVVSQNEVFTMALRKKRWPLRTAACSGEPSYSVQSSSAQTCAPKARGSTAPAHKPLMNCS